ncbi:ribonuclease H-like YkuK family protein [Niallia sp. Krafla_26]|uniref:ribonuclease H-like YkuK family protein n=1 Tax=Niallia sp. Krafla_26 TaxID=3064703 RepID=UPI003D1795E1
MNHDHTKDIYFHNLKERNMNFEDVFDRIIHFMKLYRNGNFRLMIGTDSQVHDRFTVFITGIVILNEGKGAWACIRKLKIPRRMKHLHERISKETSLTEEVVSLFDENRKNIMIDIVLPFIYKGASFTMEGHLDIGSGNRNKTRIFVEEMVSRIESMGLEPKIKPDSFVASSYANRFTK